MARLDYDDSAFIYFGFTILVMFVVPYTFTFIRAALNQFIKPDEAVNTSHARTEMEKERAKKLAKLHTKAPKYGCGFFVRLLILSVMWYFIISFFMRIGDDTVIQQFDPFEILGVDQDADPRTIKKAYRQLSKQYHPDSWVKASPSEQAAAATAFIKVTKAHDALTDDEARENWQKYGNPDGKQSMEVSIGIYIYIYIYILYPNVFYSTLCYVIYYFCLCIRFAERIIDERKSKCGFGDIPDRIGHCNSC